MDSLTFALANTPVSTITIIINCFFASCMFFPQERTERLKQPLNVLLGTLVACNISLQLCIFLYTIVNFYLSGIVVYGVILELLLLTMLTSITSSLWLNVFYYFQIVPAQTSVSIYLKRNIRFFIYSSMIAEKLLFLFGFSDNIAATVLFSQLNDVHMVQGNKTQEKLDTVEHVLMVDMWLQCGFLSFCLCVMLTSSRATIIYLQKHMKSMAGSSGSFSSPCLHKQMRVTITGIIQTFIFFICLMWMITKYVTDFVFQQNIDLSNYISCTVVCFYSFGTTINLCVGQTIFRQRLFEVWQKCLQIVTLLFK